MKVKSIGIFILVLAMTLTLSTPMYSFGAGRFSDTSGHWAEKYINQAVDKGFVKGYPDGRFLPDKAVTRAEFTTMVNKALGNSGTANLNFVDVPYSEWYYSDVSKAVAATYVAGYDDNTFKPNSPISRQEAAVMIARFVPTYGESGNLKAYSDYRSIADWAYAAMQKVNGKGYIGAYNDGKIHPTDQLSRAQTAKIICDILDEESIVVNNTTVKTDGTKLSNKIYTNNVTIDDDLDDGSVTVDNCVILGTLIVQGGGEDTITLNNSRVSNVSVNKSGDPVRVLAKGETAVSSLSASKASILQTSSLAGGLYGPGFSNITVGNSADVTLRGSFPSVAINGSSAELILESGSIKDLTITSSGKSSDITVSSGTNISNATVNAACDFHGTGTISHMAVNVDGITYETKPRNWTIASRVDTPTKADPELDITFSPKNGDTKVYLDTKITLTFSTAMKLSDGDDITNTDIGDFIELRKGSSSGSHVDFSSTIDRYKKVITLTPDNNLEASTKYYVILKKNTIEDSYGNENSAQTIYFTTGTTTDKLLTSFSPKDGATTVSVNTSITITFPESVVRYGGGSISANDSYLKDCLVFKKASGSTTVPYSASINSTKKVITITPSSSLALNQKYYVAVLGSKLKTSGGTAVPSSSASWTTGVTAPVVNKLTLIPDATTIDAKVTSNISGTAYLVVLPKSEAAPSEAQIIAGQNNAGVVVASGSRASGSVSANSEKTFTFNGLSSNSGYTVYAVIKGNGLTSTKKSATTTTLMPTTRLSSLSVIPEVAGVSDPGNQISFDSNKTSYNVTLNTDITRLTVSAKGSGSIAINNQAIENDSSSSVIDLSGSSQVIPVTISSEGTNSTTYNIQVNRTDNLDISSLVVKLDGNTLSDMGGEEYQLNTSDAVTVNIRVTTEDKFAAINIDGFVVIGSGSKDVTLSASTVNQKVEVSIKSGARTGTYELTFKRPAPTQNPPPTDSSTDTGTDTNSAV